MLLNKKQVAKVVGVSYKTLLRWVDAGKLPDPTERSGRMLYWDQSVIDKYLTARVDTRGQLRTVAK